MAYIKQTWQNNPPSTATPITAERLDHLETQYDEAIAQVAADIADPDSDIGTELNATIGDTPNYANAAAAAGMRALVGKLERGVLDATILVISDSTGDGTTDWPYLWLQLLAARYPAVTVRAIFWDQTSGTAYSAPTVVQTGTGDRVLTMYLAAVSGSVPAYFLGSRFDAAIRAVEADLILVNHGHNMGDPTTTTALAGSHRNAYLALTEEVTQVQPQANLTMIAQNPGAQAGRETWQAYKASTVEQVAGLRGYGFIDVYQAFIDYGDWLTDLINAGDGLFIHPNLAGSTLWANVVDRAARNTREAIPARLEPSALTRTAMNYITNPRFQEWEGTDPDGWEANASAAASKDLTDYETGSQALKVTGNATSGEAQMQQALGFTGARELRGELVTLAVRVFVPEGSTARIVLLDSTGFSGQRLTYVPSSARGRYQWILINKRIDIGATDVYVRLQSRPSGTSVAPATFDRVYLVKGLLPLAGS